MHLQFVGLAALVGLLVQVSSAAMCTPQNAIAVEQLVGSGSDAGSASILTAAGGLIGAGAKKRSAFPDPTNFAKMATQLGRRAAFVQCTDTEMCLSLQGAPFCYDVVTGNFRDGAGTTGNAISGDYTLVDGRRGNFLTGPHPTPTRTDGRVATTTHSVTGTPGGGTGLGTGARTGAGTGGGRGPARTASESASGTAVTTATTATQNEAARERAGPLVGALLAVVGVIL